MKNFLNNKIFNCSEHFNLNPNVCKINGYDTILYKNTDSSKIIIYSHGRNSNLDKIDSFLNKLSKDFGMSVIGYDYSTDNPTPSKINHALEIVCDYVENSLFHDRGDIILMGYSLGTGPSIYMANLFSIGGSIDSLILIAPFTSICDKINEDNVCYMGCILSRVISERYDNLETIKKVSSPILIIHGKKDEVFPFTMGETLYYTLPNKKKSVLSLKENTHHDDVCEPELLYFEYINFKNKIK